ncbi:MAG: hypothetical protein ABSC94_31405, partial [Polyangiaceae bacterium]
MNLDFGVLSLSGRPNSEIYAALREEKLDCWWNVAEELYEYVPAMRAIASEVLWAQIPDFGAPVNLELFDEQLNQVCSWLARGGRAHVSCYAGIGRTGLAIACIGARSLVHRDGDTVKHPPVTSNDGLGGLGPAERCWVVIPTGQVRV